jgi:hypothetical protein
MLSVSLTPGPTSPEETLREPASGRITYSWASFLFEGEARGENENGRPFDRYRLEAINAFRGPHAAVLRSGQTVQRVESTGSRPPSASPGTLIGSAEALASDGPEAQAELFRRWSGSRWRVALLIPFTLSPDWWRLPRDERPPTHLSWTQGAPQSPVFERALRTLYRARALPEAEWDFLAYLEMQPQDVAPVRQRLAELRKQPELRYVERAVELWMTKDLSVHPTRRI